MFSGMCRIKTMKQLFLMTFCFGIVLAVFGCSESNDPPTTPMITASSDTIEAGSTVMLMAEASDPDGDPVTFLWQGTGGSFNDSSGSAVMWTSPTVAGVYTITVDAKDSHGASSSSSVNSINITVTANVGGNINPGNGGGGNLPGNGGNVTPNEIEVIIGDNSMSLWGPFPTGRRSYGLTQYLYYANEIGMAGKIKRIAIMSNSHYQKTYTDVKISMIMVQRDALVSTLAENYEGKEPTLVSRIPTVIYGGRDHDLNKWHDFPLTTPFIYDGVSNLILKFECTGDGGDPGSTGSYAFNTREGNDRYQEALKPDKLSATPHQGTLYLKLVFEI